MQNYEQLGRGTRLLAKSVTKTHPISVFGIVVLLSGCAKSPTEIMPEQQFVGARKSIVGYSERLLAEFDGWRVSEITEEDLVTCMAVKPVEGTPWPTSERKKFWQLRVPSAWSAEQRLVSGGAGFFMYIINRVDIPYFGFYGKYPYRLPGVAEVDGTTIYDTNNRDTVLSWEGLEVAFKINTQPSENTYDVVDEATGTVNLTDVRKAYDLMMQCHAWAP